MNKRLGFFGGCFNPPTIAHIKLIEEAIEKANLDKVYFVPMGNSYSKHGLVSIEHRIKMLEVAIKHNPKLEILNLQKDQNKKMYAIDSFKIINEKFINSDNFFIMGSDNFAKIKDWKNAEELSKNYKYIVLDRDNIQNEGTIIIKSSESLKQISSSLIRKKIKNKENIDSLIIKDVQNYILENKLYE